MKAPVPTSVGVHVSLSAKKPRDTIVWAHQSGIATEKTARAEAVLSVSSMVKAPRLNTTRTTSRERTLTAAAAAHETKKTHRRVTDNVFHIAAFSPRAACAARNGYEATPEAWPKTPIGTCISRRALLSHVIAPAMRNDPKIRVIHSSTTTREKPSMIGIERRTNSRSPGSWRSMRGKNRRPALRAPWTWIAKFPTKEPARTPQAKPSIPYARPRTRPPAMIPAL